MPTTPRSRSARALKLDRQQRLLDLVSSRPVSSQHELVELLEQEGIEVTQATVSRDIAELGLLKVPSDGRHVYAGPAGLPAPTRVASDERLLRVLADYPVRIGRSGLTLLLVTEAGVANAIGQAIDESTFDEQEGTLAGENTVLVLFADETALERWQQTFERMRASVDAMSRAAR